MSKVETVTVIQHKTQTMCFMSGKNPYFKYFKYAGWLCRRKTQLKVGSDFF